MDNYALELAMLYDSVKHEPHTKLKVTDSVILSIHPEVEIFRANRAIKLLNNVGMMFEHSTFADEYTPMNPMARCYDNAAEFARKYGLIYCEGLMLLEIGAMGKFPLSHGWCCDQYGNVIDPTCSRYQHIKEVQYFGVPIQRGYADNWYEMTGYHGMLDGHQHGMEIGLYYEDPKNFLEPLLSLDAKAA